MRFGGQQRVRGLACALLLFSSAQAFAHGMRQDVRIDLTPPAIEGLVVELHQDYFSPQLAVANRTGQPLEILDDEGRAFLRIGERQTTLEGINRWVTTKPTPRPAESRSRSP